MGQCLSQSAGASRTSAESGQAKGKPVTKQESPPKATPAAEGQFSQQPAVPAPKPGVRAANSLPFPSSASDGTSAQPSGANVTTESSVARETLSQPGRPSQSHQPSQDHEKNKLPATSPAGGQERVERPATTLTVLSTCVSSPGPTCRRVEHLQTGGAATGKREETAVDAEEIVINQGGCCGPVGRKEVDAQTDPQFSLFTKEAHDNGLAGLPHDIVKYGAPRPANEDARMATVRALRNMGMQECPELDLILKMVCRVWQAPSACVTLLDSDHVFICSAEGGFTPSHRPWAVAMCPWMLLTPKPTAMAINDLAGDARFSKSLHVAGGTRSYLTAPLVASNGHRLGAICFTDVKPRKFDAGDCRLMNNCAELAIRALEAHMNVKKRLGLPGPGKGKRGRSKPLAIRAGSRAGSDAGGGGGAGGMGELDTDDGALMEEYANRVRDVADTDEAVVLLLDTRAPGWTILYASPAWEELTGMDRAEVLGATLNDVMAHVNGDARVVWEGVEREAAAGKAFVTPRVYVKSRPGITFYLSFRPGASDDLDDQTVTLGVPASVPQAVSASTSKLFFARLHTTPDPPPNTAAQSLVHSCIVTTGRRLPPNIAINPVQGLTEMFEGLVVGQVLGQGSYGTVYHARWHGVDVAIKVQDMHIRNAEERVRAEFEVGLGQRLHHLNVVHTLSHASALLERNNPSGVLDSCSSNAWHAGLQFAPLGFALASRASGNYGPSCRGSVAPESTDGLAMEGAPAFVPFFAANESDTAAAAAAAAGGSFGGGGAAPATRAQSGLVDIPDLLTAMRGSTPDGGGYVDRPSYRGPVLSANGGAGAAAGPPPSSLGLVSGTNANVVRMVALPSGAHVPMIRNTTRNAGAASGTASFPHSLAAVMAARGSSRSGSPRVVAGGAGPATSQVSDVVVTAAALSGGEDSRSGVSPGFGSSGGDGSSSAQRAMRKPSFTRFADGAAAAAQRSAVAAAAACLANGSTDVADGGAHDGADAAAAADSVVPFLTAGALAAAGGNFASEIGGVASPGTDGAGAVPGRGSSCCGGDDDDAMLATMNGGLGGGASSTAAGCTSVGRGGFGSTVMNSADTRASGANTGLSSSAVQNLATAGLPSTSAGNVAVDAAVQQEEEKPQSQLEQQQQQPAEGAGAAAAAASPPSLSTQRQQSSLLQPQQSGACAVSGTYHGMPLLPYVDGAAAGFRPGTLASGASARATTGGCGGGGDAAMLVDGVATSGAGVATTMQGAIGADLSGLSYPLDVRLWMVLEFMDRGSLQDAIDRGWLREGRTVDHGPDYPAVLATAGEIAAAVAYLHSHDVVHGDLSAVNVLLQSVRQQGDGSKRSGEPTDTSGRGFVAKISDFGLSMQLKRPDEAIKTGAYGTITHMAPEVLRDSALSKAGDVYSIGVLLWQMVTGSRPWVGLSHLQISVEVGTNMRQLVWPTWVHAGVRALGQRCLSPRPAERPTAAHVQAELAGIMRQVPQYG